MTAYDIIERPAEWPQRDQLGEGPFWSEAEAALYWVDIVHRRVQRFTPSTGAFRAWELPGHVSALVPTTRGDAIAALADGLYRLDLESGATAPFVRPDSAPDNRSNECRCDPQGRLWLGTMQNNLGPQGEALKITQASGTLSCVHADGRVVRLLDGIGIANTLCWSPDGAWLYAADSLRGVIARFPYHAEGPALGAGEAFVEGLPGSPDGSAMDEEGCLWTAFWGAARVIRFTPDGRVDRMVTLPAFQPSSCAFGDGDRRTLYVTSARQELTDIAPDSLDGSLFAIRVETAGLAMTPFAG